MKLPIPTRDQDGSGVCRWSGLCVVVLLFVASQLLAQANEVLTAEQVQAGFIYNFTKYTEWPLDSAEDEDSNHFHICVIGTGPVVEQLDLIQGKMVLNRVILIRHLTEGPNVNGCEVLYVGNLPG